MGADGSFEKITGDRNNQNILALLYLLLIPRPVGLPRVSMQDFDRTHLGMGVRFLSLIIF
jgi:hypothetical protein